MALPEHWAVEVRVNGVSVLTIESECLAGVTNIEAHADAIRNCAQHLLAFIGPDEPPPCFLCGGDPVELEPCPICFPATPETVTA